MGGISNCTAFIIACISIVLYSSLAGVCFYEASNYREVLIGVKEGGHYAKPKLIFFLALGAAAMLELPTFLACAVRGGPDDCVWDEDGIHNLVWCSHIIATCGFLYTVTSTAILWSDIIQQKDGNFFYSTSPLDYTKIFFRFAWGKYCCVVLVTMVAVMIKREADEDSESHAHSRAVGAVIYCLVPIALMLITLGSFVSGVNLERYVVSVQMETNVLSKIILNMNMTMLVICSSYTLRALMLLSLYAPMPAAYTHRFTSLYHYSIWVPLTQWFPYWFCSCCLVEQLRYRPIDRTAPERMSKSDQLELQSKTIRTFSTGSSTDDRSSGASRLMMASTEMRTRTLSYLMGQVEEGAAAGENSGRTSITSNYFDQQSGIAGRESLTRRPDMAGLDHFFTTSALHSRSSGAPVGSAAVLS